MLSIAFACENVEGDATASLRDVPASSSASEGTVNENDEFGMIEFLTSSFLTKSRVSVFGMLPRRPDGFLLQEQGGEEDSTDQEEKVLRAGSVLGNPVVGYQASTFVRKASMCRRKKSLVATATTPPSQQLVAEAIARAAGYAVDMLSTG